MMVVLLGRAAARAKKDIGSRELSTSDSIVNCCSGAGALRMPRRTSFVSVRHRNLTFFGLAIPALSFFEAVGLALALPGGRVFLGLFVTRSNGFSRLCPNVFVPVLDHAGLAVIVVTVGLAFILRELGNRLDNVAPVASFFGLHKSPLTKNLLVLSPLLLLRQYGEQAGLYTISHKLSL